LDVYKFGCVVVPICPLFVDGFFLTYYFILVDYYPTILSIAMYAISIYHYELYFFLFGLCLSLDWGINTGLQYAFGQTPRFPGCGNTYEFPSFSSQHIVLFVTLILCFFSWWKRIISPLHLFLLQLFSAIVLVARIYIGINTISQLISGAAFGLLEGVLLNYALYFILKNYSSRIEDWRIFALSGLKNTIIKRDINKKKLYKILLRTREEFENRKGSDYMDILDEEFRQSKVHIE